MEEFLRIALSFPTLIFSIGLAAMMVLWLITTLGLFQVDAMDGWIMPDFDGVSPEGIAGLMLKFGLGGVPLMVVLTVVALVAWVLSYFVQFLLLNLIAWDLVRWPLGLVAMVAILVVAMMVTGLILRPFRHLMGRLAPTVSRSVIGRCGVVRSARVGPTQGRINVEDGGAGLILNARSDSEAGFERGARVVVIEYLEAENAYRVIGEDEFHGR